jgi:hypothetical protein
VVGQAVIRKTIFGQAMSPVTLSGKSNKATIIGSGDKVTISGAPS